MRAGEVPAGRRETGARRGTTGPRPTWPRPGPRVRGCWSPEHPEWPAVGVPAFEVRDGPRPGPAAGAVGARPRRLARLAERAVAVVGSRAATGYGAHVAGELAAGLAERGWTVVSGAAIGIDGAAHRGALAVGGPTVAVLACGADRAYPAAHQALLDRIAATGAGGQRVPAGCVPGRHRFLVRNRLIAGLGAGTVVVEAGLRSGAQRTAADAGALGRAVMAVPGPVTSAVSAGCHRLIREGRSWSPGPRRCWRWSAGSAPTWRSSRPARGGRPTVSPRWRSWCTTRSRRAPRAVPGWGRRGRSAVAGCAHGTRRSGAARAGRRRRGGEVATMLKLVDPLRRRGAPDARGRGP